MKLNDYLKAIPKPELRAQATELLQLGYSPEEAAAALAEILDLLLPFEVIQHPAAKVAEAVDGLILKLVLVPLYRAIARKLAKAEPT